jgi:aryl-alcohol dehydrogenase-like predicted oxidoreductase
VAIDLLDLCSVHEAFRADVRYFDTAPLYSTGSTNPSGDSALHCETCLVRS